MNRHSIHSALVQTLENYQRCGLRWIADIGEIPDNWGDVTQGQVAGAAELTSPNRSPAAQNPASLKTASTSTPSATHGIAALAPPNSAARSKTTEAKTQSQLPEPVGTWETAELDDAARHNLFQILDREIRACRKCTEICPHRRQTVFGEGPIRPTVCFMGEAPGADEDTQGRPFVGRAGQLLTKIIAAMQLQREEVYILNSLKCRPPNNRNPSPDEILNCRPFVESQLETLRPKYIVCLGAIAARSLLQRETPVGQMRGRFFQYRGAKVLVTYHPSYLLRNEDAKRLVWEDMQLLMRELGIQLPTKK